MTATLTDDDATDDANYRDAPSGSGSIPRPRLARGLEILTATDSGYTPLGVEDKYLRVTATYEDEYDSGQSAQVVSAHVVRAAPPNNATPVFPDEDD